MTVRFVECSNIPVRLAAVALLFLAGTALRAQVPQLINYQGRVAAGGVNFTGAGQFKFALVDAAGTVSYWSNDGASIAGSEPAAAVTLTVSDGHYSVLLGDASLPNMAAIPAGVMDNTDLFLRVWFNDGANGSQQLTPDQCIATAAPVNVRDVRGGSSPVPTDAWEQQPVSAAAPAARFRHTAVWTGSEMIVWGGHDGLSTMNTGGRYDPAGNSWTAVSPIGAASGRAYHSAVWTGSDMIVWGGEVGTGLNNTGGRYNPAANTWTAVNTNGAPRGRIRHTAVWTGSEMIVWGGFIPGVSLNDGGRYNPLANNWTAVSTNGAPGGRYAHTALWTGSEMIVWGGFNFGNLHTGGRYDPAGNSWTTMSTTGAPAARYDHTAVWTGGEMIVWGGSCDHGVTFSQLNNGDRYNPAADSWTAVSPTSAPGARAEHRAVWTGSEMIVWGGYYYGNDYVYHNVGGRYDPARDSWAAASANGAPAARCCHTVVWTGNEMIVWGGLGGSGYLNTGGRYNPLANDWTTVATRAPVPRTNHTAVWTGSEMIIWGGAGSNASGLNDGWRYRPASNNRTVMTTAGAPAARSGHSAVWTGSEMIIWGGTDGASTFNDGGHYNVASNSWTVVSSTGAPAARDHHTAVWTGSEMIVWGGTDSNASVLNTGGRYNPAEDAWTHVSAAGAPSVRGWHTAVWTGSEMIVWGGVGDGYLNDGSRYNPLANNWTPVSTTGAPGGRYLHTAVWTGSEMIVWGGVHYLGGDQYWNTGGRYNPLADGWTPVSISGAPAARTDHTAVWTGIEMVVWGGFNGSFDLNTGGRYNAAGNSWTPMTTAGAPAARQSHTSVWTGSEMIVWGGEGGSGYFNDTFSYIPDNRVFDFTNVVRSGGNLTLSFRTVTGRTYTLWQSDTLTAGGWTNSGVPDLPGNGAILNFTIPDTTAARRFFRVQAGP